MQYESNKNTFEIEDCCISFSILKLNKRLNHIAIMLHVISNNISLLITKLQMEFWLDEEEVRKIDWPICGLPKSVSLYVCCALDIRSRLWVIYHIWDQTRSGSEPKQDLCPN